MYNKLNKEAKIDKESNCCKNNMKDQLATVVADFLCSK